ncbi:hypothetical protein ACFWZ7_24965 [Nocardiopsis alba]|uniref:hypothetical protein n=1 Tax=Nocardiopsis alba TaxID=53437 RepID=UPI00366D558C
MTATSTEHDMQTAQLVDYAYVLTLQFALAGGGMSHFVAETSGTLVIPQGYSRHQAFQELRQNMIEQVRQQGHPTRGEPNTIFFSLESDSL